MWVSGVIMIWFFRLMVLVFVGENSLELDIGDFFYVDLVGLDKFWIDWFIFK